MNEASDLFIPMEFSSDKEKLKLMEENQRYYFGEPRFEFLKAHRGLRPGEMHLLLGSQGKGKSTLSRSIALDLLSKGFKVFWLSTEETRKQMKTSFAFLQAENKELANLNFMHEDDLKVVAGDLTNLDGYFQYLDFVFRHSDNNVFLLDNLTTSTFYDSQPPSQQTLYVEKLRELMRKKRDIPFLIVAHTGKNVKDSVGSAIDGNDIRGVNTASNKAEQLYVYRQIRAPSQTGNIRRFSFVKIEKSRMHGASGQCFELFYDVTRKEFSGDEKISGADFKAIFERRETY